MGVSRANYRVVRVTVGAIYAGPTPLGAKAPRRESGWSKGVRDTTMIYTHVLNRGPSAMTSPADHVMAL